MSRLVDADELKLELKWLEIDKPVYHDVMSTIDEMPTVNAVEVVRCKDCKWASACYGDIVRASKGGGEVHIPLGTDGYCSFAERREDDKH